jgi:hypothetical protein
MKPLSCLRLEQKKIQEQSNENESQAESNHRETVTARSAAYFPIFNLTGHKEHAP